MATEQRIPFEAREEIVAPISASMSTPDTPLDSTSLEILDRTLSEQSTLFQKLLDRVSQARLFMIGSFLLALVCLPFVWQKFLSNPPQPSDTAAQWVAGGSVVLAFCFAASLFSTQSAHARKRIARLLPQFEELIRTASQVSEQGALPNSIYRILLRMRLVEAEELYKQAQSYRSK